jgi:hypothetical protein
LAISQWVTWDISRKTAGISQFYWDIPVLLGYPKKTCICRDIPVFFGISQENGISQLFSKEQGYPNISQDKANICRISRDNLIWWISRDISIIFCICRVCPSYPTLVACVAFPTGKSDTSY